MNEELVSIVGSSYFDPISVLLEKLKKNYNGVDGKISSGVTINGYACSICLLSVVCLESYVMRARYIHNAAGDDLNRVSVVKFISKKYSSYNLADKTNEVFVLRDLIAHNHLLKTSYILEDYGLKKIGVNRVSSGDGKFSANVNKSTEKTNILGLNTNPIMIGYKDAVAVLKTAWENLKFLENEDIQQCYVSHLHVKHEGQHILFGKLIDQL